MRVLSAHVKLVVENDAGKREEIVLLDHVTAEDEDVSVTQACGYQTIERPHGRTDFVKNGTRSVTIDIQKK